MPFLGRTPTQLVDPEVDINGGAIDGVTIGATSASPATVTTFTSTGIDDNATSTAVTIASGGDVTIDGTDASTSIASPAILNLKAGDANNEYSTLRFATSADGSIAYVGAKAITTGAYPNSVGNLQFGVQNGGSTVTAMTISNSGNVGIGNTSPSYALHTIGSSDGTIAAFGNSQDNASILLQAAANYGSDNSVDSKWSIRWRGRPNVGGHSLAIYDEENSAERLRIDSSGNVGIGTTAPSKKLHMSAAGSAAQILLESTDTTNGQIIFKNTATTTGFYVGLLGDTSGNALLYHGDQKSIQFWTHNTERMVLDSSGNLILKPGRRLYLESSSGFSPHFLEASNALTIVTNNSERMRINSAGNVGIGTTSPAAAFEVNDDSTWDTANFSGANTVGAGFTLHSEDTGVKWSLIAQGTAGGANDNNLGLHLTNAGTSGQSAGYKFTMTPAGQLGIGTTSPGSYFSSKLVVSTTDDDGITVVSSTSGAGFLSFADGTTGNQRYRGYLGFDHATDTMLYASHGDHRFYSGSAVTERMRILASGGLTFNGDTAAANALDDYEEGTWTPVIGGSTGTSGQSYSAQTGYYTKVGRLVTVSFYVQLSNKGTITGDCILSGMPYTVLNSSGAGTGVISYFNNLTGSVSTMLLNGNPNNAAAYINHVAGNSATIVVNTTAIIGTNTRLDGVYSYITS